MDTQEDPAGGERTGKESGPEKLWLGWPVGVSQWLGGLGPVGSEIRMCSICLKGAGWQDSSLEAVDRGYL